MPCLGRCSWWATNGARATSSSSSLHRRHEPPDRPCRVLPRLGLGHLSIGLASGPAPTGGLSLKLYLDDGLAFRSHHLEEIIASQGIALVHLPSYVP
ncbi:hypothetical protein DFAR_570016 [Desulfarculales bacterium]